MLNFNFPQRGAARSGWSLSLLAAFVLMMTSIPFAQTTSAQAAWWAP